MALDHYVPQVHLRHFYAPALGERMYATRKSDLKAFTPNSKGVCAINDGSTNAFLRDDRALEEFLRSIEPKYGAAVQNLAAGKIDGETVYAIAGFAASVVACSPTAVRLGQSPLKSSVQATAVLLEQQGELPPPPAELGGKTLADLLASGKVIVEVDPKFPQALGIAGVMEHTLMFGNFRWEILHNEFDDSPFFTSDFPAAIEMSADPRVLHRLVPLSPRLAVRIMPNIQLERQKLDYSFQHFDFRTRRPSRQEVSAINRLVVQCAEETVISSHDAPWVQPFIAKHRDSWIAPRTMKVPTGKGSLLWFSQHIEARSAADRIVREADVS